MNQKRASLGRKYPISSTGRGQHPFFFIFFCLERDSPILLLYLFGQALTVLGIGGPTRGHLFNPAWPEVRRVLDTHVWGPLEGSFWTCPRQGSLVRRERTLLCPWVTLGNMRGGGNPVRSRKVIERRDHICTTSLATIAWARIYTVLAVCLAHTLLADRSLATLAS